MAEAAVPVVRAVAVQEIPLHCLLVQMTFPRYQSRLLLFVAGVAVSGGEKLQFSFR